VRGNFEYTSNKTVMDVIRQAVRKIHRNYSRYIEKDDLMQEAHIFVSTRADLQGAIATEEWGLLQYRLERDLIDMLDTVVRRANKNTSYEAREEGVGEATGVNQRTFSDLHESGFRGGSDGLSGAVTTRKVVA
jgi:hypothetical protein